MAVAVANARAQDGSVLYRVTGVDCETSQGRERVQALCRGEFPFPTDVASFSLVGNILK